jgi:hypothetical protein
MSVKQLSPAIEWCTLPRSVPPCQCSRQHREDETEEEFGVAFTDREGDEVADAYGFCTLKDAEDYATTKLRDGDKKKNGKSMYAAAHIYQHNIVRTFDKTIVLK